MGYAIWRVWADGLDDVAPRVLDQVLVLVGLAGSALTAWFGRSSYPRVHNFKIYAMSFGVAEVSLISVVLVFGLPLVREATGTAIYPAAIFLGYMALLFVLLVTVVAPEYMGFRATVRLTVAMGVVIAAAFVLGLVLPSVRTILAGQVMLLRDMGTTTFWAVSAVAVAVLFLSLFTEPRSLGIGGMHAGAVVLLSVGWLPPDADILLQGTVLAWMPILIAVGTLSHWFQRLENRANYDPLLRIYNRGWCEQVLAEQSRVDTRPPFAVALIDLDHFKQVNDTHGHDAGDMVLQETAQRIRMEVVPRGSVGRYGGEELIVFIPRTDQEEARTLLEKVRAAVASAPVRYKKVKIPVTCSIGFALRSSRDQPLATVLKAADRAVYVAKDKGRNQVRMGRLRRKSPKG